MQKTKNVHAKVLAGHVLLHALFKVNLTSFKKW